MSVVLLSIHSNVAIYLITWQAVKGKVGVIMAGKNQRENMDWVMTELDLHHVKERDVEVRINCTTYMLHCTCMQELSYITWLN